MSSIGYRLSMFRRLAQSPRPLPSMDTPASPHLSGHGAFYDHHTPLVHTKHHHVFPSVDSTAQKVVEDEIYKQTPEPEQMIYDPQWLSSMSSEVILDSIPRDMVISLTDVLLRRTGAQHWKGYALAHHSKQEVDDRVKELIQEHTRSLMRHCNNDSAFKEQLYGLGAKSVKAPRTSKKIPPHLAILFQEVYLRLLQELCEQVSFGDRLWLIPKDQLNDKRTSESAIMSNHAVNGATQQILWDFLNEYIWSEDFMQLARKLRQALYHDDQAGMKRVHQCLLGEAIPRAVPRNNAHKLDWVKIEIELPLMAYMRAQFHNGFPSIGSVVVLTGSSLYAQATTCTNYIQAVWPRIGDTIVRLLDSAIKNIMHTPDETTRAWFQSFDSLLDMEVWISESENTCVEVRAPEHLVIDVVQELAWIGSALRSSPFGEEPAYVRPDIRVLSPWEHYHIKFIPELIHESEKACWLPLFDGAVIAAGFPVTPREEELGVEIPFSILVAMAGIRQPVEINGGIVMKGFSDMLIPISKTENRIQWHLVSSQDAEIRLTYANGLSRCKNRALLQEVGFDDIKRCRAFVGWCTVATSRLGSDHVNYDDILYSGSPNADSKLRLTGGSFGFQQFATAALDFRLGQNFGRRHFQRNGPYQRVVSAAHRTSIVLYDTSEQRAWLVPASGVLLHMFQHRSRLEPFVVDGKEVNVNTTISNHYSYKDILLANEYVVLSDSSGQTFKDVILDYWTILEFLQYQDSDSAGVTLHPAMGESICGYEWKAVIEDRSPYWLKKVRVKNTHGGWPHLARDIDALVLIARGFEDIIVPSDEGNDGLCQKWNRVPKHGDYLATTTQSLRELYEIAGNEIGGKSLTPGGLQWHQGHSVLFDTCKCPKDEDCSCNRLQRIVSSSFYGLRRPTARSIRDGGAIIFGRTGLSLHNFAAKALALSPRVASIFGISKAEDHGAQSRSSVSSYPSGASGVSQFTDKTFPDSTERIPSHSSSEPSLVTLPVMVPKAAESLPPLCEDFKDMEIETKTDYHALKGNLIVSDPQSV